MTQLDDAAERQKAEKIMACIRMAELGVITSKVQSPKKELSSETAAEPAKESPEDLEAAKRNAELLAKRKAELIGQTVTGRLKPSSFGSRKGFFIIGTRMMSTLSSSRRHVLSNISDQNPSPACS